MRGLNNSTPYAGGSVYSAPYTPQQVGAEAGQVTGQIFTGVAQPVVGFASGFFGVPAIVIGVSIIALVLINAREGGK